MLIDGLRNGIEWLSNAFPPDFWLNPPYMLRGFIAISMVSLICGAVGSLVVGNRMAFFSDALAHCAFAGVTLGMLISLSSFRAESQAWSVPTIMVAFGILVGFGIAFVRENTTLSSDTIIGVFFAFAVGFGAMLLNAFRRSSYMDPEKFLFGSVLFVSEGDILVLVALTALLLIVLIYAYNPIVLGSFNPTLARSRGVRVRFWNYAFILLLALIVNLCLKAVGALLINALLVVPAATAANLSRGVRAMFWWTIAISVFSGMAGLWLSHRVQIPMGSGQALDLIPSGTIVVVCVFAFLVSLVARIGRDRRVARFANQPSV